MDRSFKWIWIPKEIWLNESLNMPQKLLLVEISSLDNDEWCFASNAYFSEFFWVSERQITRDIAELKANWLIEDVWTSAQRRLKVLRGRQKCLEGVDKNVWHNNIINILSSLGKKENLENPNKEEKEVIRDKLSHLLSLYTDEIKTDMAKFSLEEIVDIWNSVKEKDRNWKAVNKANQWTKVWADLQKAFDRTQKSYTQDQFFSGLEEYLKEIKWRNQQNDYAKHRFTLTEFLRQSNGLQKFILLSE